MNAKQGNFTLSYQPSTVVSLYPTTPYVHNVAHGDMLIQNTHCPDIYFHLLKKNIKKLCLSIVTIYLNIIHGISGAAVLQNKAYMQTNYLTLPADYAFLILTTSDIICCKSIFIRQNFISLICLLRRTNPLCKFIFF